ncbi:hypothetical protein JR316_0008419 [Psilocybe cubensis]|uniref:Uncharacterized protein n=1 Tax=Psilocybe cubensis TaxID=181762 RepID=A0ACB8GXT5_PSICU|nr:hypothetical protein JR316_0008419 [Psilocybe cubensis]KAH9479824.1 hypothetical protein JR316_0008419 [Psilocybe cubensis]
MLSDEMTTGSVNSSEAHKRAFAARSHSWNITQQRFKDAFPEVRGHVFHCTAATNGLGQYSTPLIRDLPNMGEKERGKPDPVPNVPSASFAQPPQITATGSSSAIAVPTRIGSDHFASSALSALSLTHYEEARSTAVARPDDATLTNRAAGPPPAAAPGWTATWRSFIYEKWRLCAFIAVALMVSRFSTRT